jgi:hypothetical protein
VYLLYAVTTPPTAPGTVAAAHPKDYRTDFQYSSATASGQGGGADGACRMLDAKFIHPLGAKGRVALLSLCSLTDADVSAPALAHRFLLPRLPLRLTAAYG